MDLPELPRQINKKEQDITPRILKWFRDNYKKSFALEIKISNTDTLSKSRVEKHQIQALQLVNSGIFVYKIRDTSRMQNPFDAFGLYGVDVWIVIYFTKHKKFVALSLRTFMNISQIRHDTPSELPIK